MAKRPGEVAWGKTRKRLEPQAIDQHRAQTLHMSSITALSAAISLKRIADALEKAERQ